MRTLPAPREPAGALEAAVAQALRSELPHVVDELAAIGGPRAYTVVEVAERLEVSEATVRRLLADGHLQAVPHLSPTRIAATTLNRFLTGGARECSPTPRSS